MVYCAYIYTDIYYVGDTKSSFSHPDGNDQIGEKVLMDAHHTDRPR